MNTDKKRILETFLEFVKIYSPPEKEGKLADLIIEKLSLVGIVPEKDEIGNLVAVIPAKEGIEAPGIFLSAHLDVVEPCSNVKPMIEEIENDKIIRSDGTTVLGADDKAGLAMIIEAITSIIEKDLDHGEIELIFTVQEETGLFGAKEINPESIKASFGYILDHSAPIGTVINRAPHHDNLIFRFKGRAAHAGLQPENGINAILVAAKAIEKMPSGRLDEYTTANVGTINGGMATNIIPDDCTVTCEVRSHNPNKLTHYVEKYIEAANDAVKKTPGTLLETFRETEYKSISIDPQTSVIKFAKIAAEKLDIEFKLEATNGGSDANIFNHNGLPCVCLGCGYNEPHSTNESITLSNLIQGAEYTVAIIQSVIGYKDETDDEI